MKHTHEGGESMDFKNYRREKLPCGHTQLQHDIAQKEYQSALTDGKHGFGIGKTVCELAQIAFPLHTPQTKETESVDAIVEEIVQESYVQFPMEDPDDADAGANWLREKLLSLQAQNQAKIDEAVREYRTGLLDVLEPYREYTEIEEVYQVIKGVPLTPKDI